MSWHIKNGLFVSHWEITSRFLSFTIGPHNETYLPLQHEPNTVYTRQIYWELKKLRSLHSRILQSKGKYFNSRNISIIRLISIHNTSQTHFIWINSVENWQRYEHSCPGHICVHHQPETYGWWQIYNMNWKTRSFTFSVNMPPYREIL